MKTGLRISPVMLAVILMAVCIVPALVLKDVSPSNELRYLSIADEALENGSVFTFSNHGEPYADKPPLYLWLVMLSRLFFGCHDTFVLSLLSFVPAMVTIAVMDRWLILVSRHSTLRFSSGERFAAAMMTGTSVMFLGSAVVLRMDMMMTMFIVLSLFTFYKMYRGIGNAGVQGILLPVYIFLALFTKGPVGLLMPVAGIAVFLLVSGKIRDIGKYLGIRTWGILALLCGLWFLGVWLEGGKDYLYNLLFHQTVDRAVNAFHHKRPFWYYLTTIWYVAAPYSIAMIYSMLSRSGMRGYVTDAGLDETGRRLLASPLVRREWPFNLRMNAQEALGVDSQARVVVQGVVDCCFMEDGAWVLLDYKTDRLEDEDLLRRYRAQVELYRKALERITGIPVKETLLCLLSAGRELRV